ncbi:MAG: hypothetical protein C0595_12520 [Marinilabiliales bacterium]|nr:MAG: hypothetical protein C0595_12520 [Marinilabiliales bacterium]
MIILNRLILLVFFSFILNSSFGQGCSDAGACSVESLNFDNPEINSQNHLSLNIEQSFGLGEKFVFISQTTAGIQYRITKFNMLELRIPFIYTAGNLGNSMGVGDLLLSINQRILSKNKHVLSAIIAGRIKTNDANKSFNNAPLPMAYQTSLGTYDIILGAYYRYVLWDFYLAYQHSFGRNSNSYLNPFNENNDNKLYYESNKLKRGDDLYFRARHFFNLKNENQIIVNSLFIYRIQQDEIVKNGSDVKLAGSEGLTVNLAVAYSTKLKNNRKLEYTLAFPIVDKDYRSDGLTRNVVIGIRLINL